ncbi:retinol dehydrogenase 12-like [Mizuhopecten yessoensis]|uniref:Short-chain dehydrogenase TIC 32, chloroplastic n=1 Tax=Mizuhopecten yessoensis TaxID=6573 RepID=A0A210PWC3_MIZYE|nr:retinol dehydrogenase 12-like [Mizuhopecten yessoensis]OWF40774.1 Short-chain dehydrogenase TIC 32, chloroplastic [Mizuhopecten yessoensis]
MTGRVIIITGANSGIGFRAAEQLCEAGNDVILACRSEERAKSAIEKILKRSPNALATFMQCDVADLSSVRKFVEDFHATGKKLHVLVNNAGVYLSKENRRQFSADNFELTMGTNHLGPFLLTHLLLDDLKKTAADGEADCRIINVTSSLHDSASPPNNAARRKPLDVENFFLEKEGTYNNQLGYKNSKLAMVLTTYELSKRLQDTGVTVNTLCPGFIPSTELCRHAGGGQKFFLRYILGGMLRPVMKPVKTLEDGAKAIMDLVVNEKFKGVTGKYYKDLVETESSEESKKEELQTAVYELSARYIHLEGYEPLDAPIPPPEEPTLSPKKSKKVKKAAVAEETAGPSGDEAATKEDDKETADKTDDEIKFADEDDKPEETAVVKIEESEKEVKDSGIEEAPKETEKEEEVKDSEKEDEVKDSGEKDEEVKDSGKEDEVKDSGKEDEVKDSGKEEVKEVESTKEVESVEEGKKIEETAPAITAEITVA